METLVHGQSATNRDAACGLGLFNKGRITNTWLFMGTVSRHVHTCSIELIECPCRLPSTRRRLHSVLARRPARLHLHLGPPPSAAARRIFSKT